MLKFDKVLHCSAHGVGAVFPCPKQQYYQYFLMPFYGSGSRTAKTRTRQTYTFPIDFACSGARFRARPVRNPFGASFQSTFGSVFATPAHLGPNGRSEIIRNDWFYNGSRDARFREISARTYALGNAFPYFLETPGEHRAPRVPNVLPFLLITVAPF